MNTNSINEYVQIGEDALRSVGNLSNEALACVAIYLFGLCAKLVLTNGRKSLRRFIPVGSIVVVGPFANWLLWWVNITGAGDIDYTIRNVWVAKLIYGGLFAFGVIAFHELIGRRWIDKYIFTDDGNTKFLTRKQAGHDAPVAGDSD